MIASCVQNPLGGPVVWPGMEPFDEVHVARPGLIVLDIAAADDQTATALAFQEAISGRWATATAERTTREPGRPGMRLRCYLNLRQEPGHQAEEEPVIH